MIFYTSSTNPTNAALDLWAPPRVLHDFASTDAAPEVILYQMYGGALGEPAVFWVYARQTDPGTSKFPQGTSVFTAIPTANGDLGGARSHMHLSPARVGPGAYAHPFHSAVQWGNMLRVFFPYQYGSTTDGVYAMWSMTKAGDG